MNAGASASLVVAALLFDAQAALALESFRARCVAVLDGDSLRVLRGREEIGVRLHGIDAPEHRQDFAERAKETLSGLIYGKEIEVARVTTDLYGRFIADVFVGDLNVNLEMVRRGLAWHYKRYSTDPSLAAAETAARARRAGLWVDPAPVPPWSFRRDATPTRSDRPGDASPSQSRAPAADGEVHGNTSSRVFHRASCPNYRCRNCTAIYPSAAAAQAAGYEPAGCCHPAAR